MSTKKKPVSTKPVAKKTGAHRAQAKPPSTNRSTAPTDLLVLLRERLAQNKVRYEWKDWIVELFKGFAEPAGFTAGKFDFEWGRNKEGYESLYVASNYFTEGTPLERSCVKLVTHVNNSLLETYQDHHDAIDESAQRLIQIVKSNIRLTQMVPKQHVIGYETMCEPSHERVWPYVMGGVMALVRRLVEDGYQLCQSGAMDRDDEEASAADHRWVYLGLAKPNAARYPTLIVAWDEELIDRDEALAAQ